MKHRAAIILVVVVTGILPPIPTTPVDPVARWQPIVALYFAPEHVDQAMRVLACESRGNPQAKNRTSTASGLFQFIRSTWDWVRTETNVGLPHRQGGPFNPWANIRNAAWLSRRGSWWAHWECQP